MRPHVFRLATELGIRGDVRNVGGHVVITASGQPGTLSAFRQALHEHAPRHARIDNITVTPHEDAGHTGFVVRDSGFEAGPRIVVPDLATCDACVAELFDPDDRRYRYPFINCTDCGPRATIVESLPYDRSRTTMRGFPLCASCSAEYHDPADRRFHAEPTACSRCASRRSATTTRASPARPTSSTSPGNAHDRRGDRGRQRVPPRRRRGPGRGPCAGRFRCPRGDQRR
ncbi:acylphosphatase [Lentzea miocenica]|uniref:acylphosphatase n=1 Tax=Lentzea miocenica TaxID=3095431 RepID=UPI0038735AAC